jgi:hypothetical protein
MVVVTMVALVDTSVATLVVTLEVATTTLTLVIATTQVTVLGARSVVAQITWPHSAGTVMMTATRWMRSPLLLLSLHHPTPST